MQAEAKVILRMMRKEVTVQGGAAKLQNNQSGLEEDDEGCQAEDLWEKQK